MTRRACRIMSTLINDVSTGTPQSLKSTQPQREESVRRGRSQQPKADRPNRGMYAFGGEWYRVVVVLLSHVCICLASGIYSGVWLPEHGPGLVLDRVQGQVGPTEEDGHTQHTRGRLRRTELHLHISTCTLNNKMRKGFRWIGNGCRGVAACGLEGSEW